MPSVKILISYHKEFRIFKDEILTPICVGAEIFQKNNSNSELKKWFELNTIPDNTFDNISSKNKYYNEMTAIYWAWKNYDQLGNPDYIGFEHYRRHFIFEERKQPQFTSNGESEDYLVKELNYSKKTIDEFLKKSQLIVPKPLYYKSVYDQYKNTLDISELDCAIEILKKLKPEYSKACDEYICGNTSFFYNMFIMPRSLFYKYCEYIFPILEQYEKTRDMTGKRMYISERLTGIFIHKCMSDGIKCTFLPTMFIEEDITVPIVMATDEKYIVPTATAITSIMENSKKTNQYEFNILESNAYDSIKNALQPISKRYQNCKIIIHEVKPEQEYEIKISHISMPTFYRLYMFDILKKYKKCIYIDGDVIVSDDLSIIFRTDISEKYIAGVRAAGYYYPEDWVKKHSAEIGIPIDQYINAGFLLVNLEKIRNDHIDKKMLELVKNGYSSQDQDVINIACYNNIRFLDYKWNSMIKYLKKYENKIIMDERASKIYDMKTNIIVEIPKVIHYADKIKPWSGDCIYSEIWHKYNNKYNKIIQETKISIIVPVYNKEIYLEQCLDSIINQTLKEIEIICINDGSTDNSLKILKEYSKKDSRIVVIDQENKGVASSRNTGIDSSNSEYMCFMDPDDYYPSNDVLSNLYSAAKINNSLIAGGSWSEDINGVLKTKFDGKYNKYTFEKEELVKFSNYQFDYGFQRFIYSTNFIKDKNIKFPQYIRYQDPPFLVKAMCAANTFYAIPQPVYRYRLGQQKLEWNDIRCRDFMLGIIDNLRISSRENLANLHRLNLDRINHEYAKRLVDRIKNPDSDPYLFELMIRANSAVDRKLLKTIIPTMTDNYCIQPLMELIKYFKSNNRSNRRKLLNILKK